MKMYIEIPNLARSERLRYKVRDGINLSAGLWFDWSGFGTFSLPDYEKKCFPRGDKYGKQKFSFGIHILYWSIRFVFYTPLTYEQANPQDNRTLDDVIDKLNRDYVRTAEQKLKSLADTLHKISGQQQCVILLDEKTFAGISQTMKDIHEKTANKYEFLGGTNGNGTKATDLISFRINGITIYCSKI